MKKITFRSIQRSLSKCSFNPNDSGPLKIITEVNNPYYYLQRSIEFISEALQISDKIHDSESLENYNDRLIKSIQLIILAKEYKNNAN